MVTGQEPSSAYHLRTIGLEHLRSFRALGLVRPTGWEDGGKGGGGGGYRSVAGTNFITTTVCYIFETYTWQNNTFVAINYATSCTT